MPIRLLSLIEIVDSKYVIKIKLIVRLIVMFSAELLRAVQVGCLSKI